MLMLDDDLATDCRLITSSGASLASSAECLPDSIPLVPCRRHPAAPNSRPTGAILLRSLSANYYPMMVMELACCFAVPVSATTKIT